MIRTIRLLKPRRGKSDVGSAARRHAQRIAVALLIAGSSSVALGRANELYVGEQAFAREDYGRAAAIFVREAERGDAVAQTYLGSMYTSGRGVPQDYVAAVQWLRRASDQGYPAAQFLLGMMFDKGHGVKQDFVEAEILLDLATAHAEPKVRDYWTRIRDAVAGKLTQDELAYAQKAAVEWRPIQDR
jgi:TPR repeat protein